MSPAMRCTHQGIELHQPICQHCGGYFDDARAENARLREAVRALREALVHLQRASVTNALLGDRAGTVSELCRADVQAKDVLAATAWVEEKP